MTKSRDELAIKLMLDFFAVRNAFYEDRTDLTENEYYEYIDTYFDDLRALKIDPDDDAPNSDFQRLFNIAYAMFPNHYVPDMPYFCH